MRSLAFTLFVGKRASERDSNRKNLCGLWPLAPPLVSWKNALIISTLSHSRRAIQIHNEKNF